MPMKLDTLVGFLNYEGRLFCLDCIKADEAEDCLAIREAQDPHGAMSREDCDACGLVLVNVAEGHQDLKAEEAAEQCSDFYSL